MSLACTSSASTENPDQLAGSGASPPTDAMEAHEQAVRQTAEQQTIEEQPPTQRPTIEEGVADEPTGDQQAAGRTTVLEEVGSEAAEHGTSAPSMSSVEGSGAAPMTTKQDKQQQSEVLPLAESSNAIAHGKAMLVPDAVEAGPAPGPEAELKEEEDDVIEEVVGHP